LILSPLLRGISPNSGGSLLPCLPTPAKDFPSKRKGAIFSILFLLTAPLHQIPRSRTWTDWTSHHPAPHSLCFFQMHSRVNDSLFYSEPLATYSSLSDSFSSFLDPIQGPSALFFSALLTFRRIARFLTKTLPLFFSSPVFHLLFTPLVCSIMIITLPPLIKCRFFYCLKSPSGVFIPPPSMILFFFSRLFPGIRFRDSLSLRSRNSSRTDWLKPPLPLIWGPAPLFFFGGGDVLPLLKGKFAMSLFSFTLSPSPSRIFHWPEVADMG